MEDLPEGNELHGGDDLRETGMYEFVLIETSITLLQLIAEPLKLPVYIPNC